MFYLWQTQIISSIQLNAHHPVETPIFNLDPQQLAVKKHILTSVMLGIQNITSIHQQKSRMMILIQISLKMRKSSTILQQIHMTTKSNQGVKKMSGLDRYL